MVERHGALCLQPTQVRSQFGQIKHNFVREGQGSNRRKFYREHLFIYGLIDFYLFSSL